MGDTPLLDVENLSVSYRLGKKLFGASRTLNAVRGVSFQIERGKTYGLVGESGSGKSTIGRAVLRLAEISGGRVLFDGRDISDFGKKTPLSYRRDVQVVFQDPASSLNPKQTIGQTLVQVARRHLDDTSNVEEEVVAALQRVGLAEHHAGRRPGQLSGGQRQRVAIARALIVRPRLIVCDEPVSALDLSTQGQVINLLKDLQNDLGISYLFIAHDLTVVRHISDHLGVMYLGEIVESGPTEQVYRAPGHPYTRVLLEAMMSVSPQSRRRDMEIRRRIGEPASPLAIPAGCSFHPRCPVAADICRSEEPQQHELGDGHRAGCHFAESVTRAQTLDDLRGGLDPAVGRHDSGTD